ncbi:hypothetical protein TIFTF001_037876 [Ficus carica]|uniref:Uncharacterized protein n=1 Tax=Ficus carica TaxID=3494 RepID=A0AA88JCA9_FICCA|nr:hypothetical protein TIFTF001_037876 [Ficus carica]
MLYTQLSPHLCCNGSQPLGNIPSGSLASTHRLRLFPNPLATFPSGEAVRPPPTDYNFSLTAGNHLLPLCPPIIPVTIFLSLVARLLPLLASRHDSVVVASFASLHFTIPNQIKQEETCPSPDLPHRHRPKRQNLLPKNKNKSANEKFHHIHCRSDYPKTAELTINERGLGWPKNCDKVGLILDLRLVRSRGQGWHGTEVRISPETVRACAGDAQQI